MSLDELELFHLHNLRHFVPDTSWSSRVGNFDPDLMAGYLKRVFGILDRPVAARRGFAGERPAAPHGPDGVEDQSQCAARHLGLGLWSGSGRLRPSLTTTT